MKRVGILSIALALAVTVACDRNNGRSDIGANNTANDNTAVGTAGENRSMPTAGDKDFIEDQLAAGMAEIELGKLASERGQSADVKHFAQMMVTDHTKAGEELKRIANQYNVTPPAALDAKHSDLRDKLSKLQGAEFDREYMNAMVDGHQDVIDHLESRVDQKTLGSWKERIKNPIDRAKGTSGSDVSTVVMPERSDNPATSAVNQWAANTLPTAQMHLDHAKSLHDKVDRRGRNSTR
jgi:putative membrane protein